MSFTNPIWLWGLAGLIVPVAIHLLSLKEGKTIYIGSVRHLRESNTAQFSSIRLNEILLLAIRSLLIIILILFLAGFQFDPVKNASQKWLVVDPGIINDQRGKTVIDSLRNRGYEVRLLTSDFPPASDSAIAEPSKNNWVLVQSLAEKKLDDAVVISNNLAKDFRGQRSSKPANLKWVSIPPQEKTEDIKTWNINKDSSWTRVSESSSAVTEFHSRFSPSTNGQTQGPIRILVHADNEFEPHAKILVASIRAIDTVVPFTISIDKKNDNADNARYDWIVWLSKKPLSPEYPNVMTISSCDETTSEILRQGIDIDKACGEIKDHWWVVTKQLNEDAALAQNLTVRLANILLDEYQESALSGQRTLDDNSLWSENRFEETNYAASTNSSSGLLMSLFALTLLVERFFAYKKKQ